MQNIFDSEVGAFADGFYLHCNAIVFVHFVHSSEQMATRRWRLVVGQESLLETTRPSLAYVSSSSGAPRHHPGREEILIRRIGR